MRQYLLAAVTALPMYVMANAARAANALWMARPCRSERYSPG
jgi:hypothetical protein